MDDAYVPLPYRVTLEDLYGLAKVVENQCPERRGHGVRTARLSVKLGRLCGLPRKSLQDLSWAGIFHDLGLLTIPPSVLQTTEGLRPDEFRLLQSHPRAGARMVEQVPFLQQAAILIAHHHERWDGAGYPYGIQGEFIPLGSRILAIADAFDAYTIVRPSQPIADNRTALRILSLSAGAMFDPRLVELFCRSWHEEQQTDSRRRTLIGEASDADRSV
jgi:HD-GYP domain-containing protein (c-di-GMP phosphodiesterase class II)